jgi:hypothetical protein
MTMFRVTVSPDFCFPRLSRARGSLGTFSPVVKNFYESDRYLDKV